MENCVCILRNLSYHVHKEIPVAERFLEPGANHLRRAAPRKRSEPECLGGKKSKGLSVVLGPLCERTISSQPIRSRKWVAVVPAAVKVAEKRKQGSVSDWLVGC